MTISINSGVTAKRKTTSSCSTVTHGARHPRKTPSRVHSIDKAKTGWMGAALLRGRGGIALPSRRTALTRQVVTSH